MELLEKRSYPYPEPEWTSENINRKQGDTTFKQCGWCEHASCGSVRYGCYLSTSCSLLKKYGIGNDVYWDTPCIVKMLGDLDFESIISSKRYEIEEHENAIEELREEIKTINRLPLENIPPLPDHRTSDYFQMSEVVYVLYENKWTRGIVVSGYRTHDGCVSYILDDYPESKGGKDGPWGCGNAVPCVLKEWEAEFFRQNPKRFKVWLDLCDKEYNGKRIINQEYFDAMIAKTA